MWALKIFEIAVRNRRFILINVFVVTLAAIIISLLLPKHYRATASILPPENERALNGLMGLSMGNLAAAVSSFSLPIMATPSDLYASILKSDTILIRVVDKFGLQDVYRTRTRWSAVSNLREHLVVKVESEGIVKITVDSKESTLCADIANAMIEYLDVFIRELEQQKGLAYSTFLQQRLIETDSASNAAATALRDFQDRYRAVSLESQSEALIKTLAEQKGRLTSSEIELEIMKQSLSPDHPLLLAKQLEIRETRRRLLDIEGGAQTRTDSVISALDIPLAVIPELSLKYAVLVRNLKIQEVSFELLSQQNEVYRLQAQRDTPTLSKLDRAHPPEGPFRPRKRIIVATVFALSLMLTIAYAVFRAHAKDESNYNSELVSRLRAVLLDLRQRPLG